MKREDVYTVVKLVFESIAEAIMVDDEVKIRNFGKIRARYIPGGKLVWCQPVQREVPRKPNIKLVFTPAQRLRSVVSRARMRMRAHAKKEQAKDNGQVQL